MQPDLVLFTGMSSSLFLVNLFILPTKSLLFGSVVVGKNKLKNCYCEKFVDLFCKIMFWGFLLFHQCSLKVTMAMRMSSSLEAFQTLISRKLLSWVTMIVGELISSQSHRSKIYEHKW